MKYWLMKSEPSVFSIDDLAQKKKSLWDGVRNYQARNYMTKEMRVGDSVLFYHSNAQPTGVAGTGIVSSAAVADPSQFDKASPHFDPKAKASEPIWFCVEVGFTEKFQRVVTLEEIRKKPELKSMLLLRPGQRLSIMPVTLKEYETILKMAKQPG